MTQQTETLASLKDHYLSAVTAGDTNRAMDVAEQYRRLTDRLISEDLPQQPAASYQDYYRDRWEALRDMPREDLIPVRR